MSNTFEEDIRELQKKLEKLHQFSSQTNSLFASSLNDMKIAMQGVMVLNNTVVNSDGTYQLPAGVDSSWFNQLKEKKQLDALNEDKQPDVGDREYKLIDLGYGKMWLWVEKGKNFATAADIDVTLAYNKWLSQMIDKYGLSFIQGDRPKGIDELFYEQNATLIKELKTGIDSVTGKKLTQAEMLGKASLLANGMITLGVMAKGVVNVGKVKNATPRNAGEKAGGAESVKQPNDFATEPFLPEEYYKNNRLPSRVEPGTSSLDKFDDLGNLKQTKFYDQYGREKGWVDYTDHGRPDSHSAPHWHEYIYDAEFPLGKKVDHKFDINPPFSK
ncbi:hypothetical protein [Candidatus Enterococcus mansonii]|uniref:LXG domain-containing protein n=1 Tax=Candidatus Enterococcus mansonii TaxID=1834181 RepID=A0ABU8IC56_9ENTE